MQFPVDGVHLSGEPKCSPTFCDLELSKLEARSAGIYRCEVSTEAPTFSFANKNATMTVAGKNILDYTYIILRLVDIDFYMKIILNFSSAGTGSFG